MFVCYGRSVTLELNALEPSWKPFFHLALDVGRVAFDYSIRNVSILYHRARHRTYVRAYNWMSLRLARSELLILLNFCAAGASNVGLVDSYCARDCRASSAPPQTCPLHQQTTPPLLCERGYAAPRKQSVQYTKKYVHALYAWNVFCTPAKRFHVLWIKRVLVSFRKTCSWRTLRGGSHSRRSKHSVKSFPPCNPKFLSIYLMLSFNTPKTVLITCGNASCAADGSDDSCKNFAASVASNTSSFCTTVVSALVAVSNQHFLQPGYRAW